MIKAKWLYSELPISINQLARLMKGHQYNESTGSGFLLSTSYSNRLIGKYIEKVVQISVIEDPFGVTSEVESISYYTCNFDWILDSNYLLIMEPPRSLRKFVNKLHDLTGLGLVISELNVCPKDWLLAIEKQADTTQVLQISAFGIKSSQTSTAKISVKGSSDVREAFSSIISNRRYLIDSIMFESNFGSLTVKGELTKVGGGRIKTTNSAFALDIFRDALEATRILEQA